MGDVEELAIAEKRAMQESILTMMFALAGLISIGFALVDLMLGGAALSWPFITSVIAFCLVLGPFNRARISSEYWDKRRFQLRMAIRAAAKEPDQ